MKGASRVGLGHFIGWCSPSGEFHRCAFGKHGETACQILYRGATHLTYRQCDSELFARGWVRVAAVPQKLESLFIHLPKGFNDKQYRALRQLAAELAEQGGDEAAAAFLMGLDEAVREQAR